MRGLEGKRIIVTGVRKADEMSTIVEKLGGTPVLRPAQVTMAVAHDELDTKMNALLDQHVDWVIFTTGVGVQLMTESTKRMGRFAVFQEQLMKARVAVRGRKTVKFLQSLGIHPIAFAEDGTIAGLMEALHPFSFAHERVVLQLYGMTIPGLAGWLTDRQAEVVQISPYLHTAPDQAQMDLLVGDILDGNADAVTFTSAAQVQFLMEYAREKEVIVEMVAAFQRITPVAVGKVTAEALYVEGVQRVIVPKEERMGTMLVTLAKYFEEQRT